MPVASRDRHEIVTVVGNGVAGYACAARLAQQGRQVRMIGPGLPHDRPPFQSARFAAAGYRCSPTQTP